MGTRLVCSEAAVRDERGSAVLEMALLIPMLLVLALGISMLGHAYMTRYMLGNAAYAAARTCALAGEPNVGCAQTVVTGTFPGGLTGCKAPLGVVAMETESGLETVKDFVVTINCDYDGVLGTKYLRKEGVTIGTVSASALMPY